MGSIITQTCCCCGICLNQCKEALKQLIGLQRYIRLLYILLIIVFVIPSIFIFFFLYHWSAFNKYFSEWINCPYQNNFQCIGSQVIYRLSLSLVSLFLIMTIFMSCKSKLSRIINEGLFWCKYFVIIAIFIGFLFVKNSPFEQYSLATRYISIFFMVIQSIILIDLFYVTGIKWVKKYDQGEIQYGLFLIISTTSIYSIAIGLNVYGYILFSNDENGICTSTLWLNIITSFLLLILPIFQFFQFNKQNSLLTTSLVSLYFSYLSFIAQFSFPGKCTRLNNLSLIIDIAVSIFIFIITMYGSAMGGSGQIKLSQEGDLNRTMGIAPHNQRQNNYLQGVNDPVNPMSDQQLKQQQRKQKERKVQQEKKKQKQNEIKKSKVEVQMSNQQVYLNTWIWVKWHIYMTLASIYVSVLITNWNKAGIISKELHPSGFSFWVRVGIAWVTVLIYIWTLVAPKIFENRDFNVV